MSAARHLKPVTAEQQLDGEIKYPTDVRDCWTLLDEAAMKLAAAERDLRTRDVVIGNLRRDKEREARAGQKWPAALRLFKIWRKLGNHGSAKFTYRRFECIEPFLKDYDPEKHDLALEPGPPANPLEECAAAIAGRTYDCFSKPRPNGTTKRFDEWERIFEAEKRYSGQFDESVARRPRDWRQRVREVDPSPPLVEPEPELDEPAMTQQTLA